MLRILFSAVLAAASVPVSAQTLHTSAGDVTLTNMLDGLDTPWAIGFLPDGDYLVTERGGALLYVSEGKTQAVRNVPSVAASGQAGLLDVTISRDFATSREVFLTYAREVWRGSRTALAVARLSEDGQSLQDVQVVFQSSPKSHSGRHFGSRVVERNDGTLFVTVGERGDRPAAQDRSNHAGSIVRINRDGTVPADNPFVGQAELAAELWSYGHRNPQGAALDGQGDLWVAEHGAQGGDEINRIQKGANYGWPVISYGVHYSGDPIGEGTAKDGMQQPEFYWDPSIAPSGMMFYSGKLWPQWTDDAFVGSLKFSYLARLAGDPLREVEQIKNDDMLRIRDVAEAPDGSIWFISEANGTIYRMTPGSE